MRVAFPRSPRSEVTIGGRDIAAGELVLCSLLAADRDQRLIGDAAALDLGHPPTRHVALRSSTHSTVLGPEALPMTWAAHRSVLDRSRRVTTRRQQRQMHPHPLLL